MSHARNVGQTVALDMPGDPHDGMLGEIIALLPSPWYRIRWSNGQVVNFTDALLKEPPCAD